jgi:hypothetical protein
MSAVDHASASAEQLQGHGRMMRLLEAYMYDNDASEWEQCRTHVLAYVQQLRALSAAELEQ